METDPKTDPKTDPNVVIVILNWNGWQDTIQCLKSLYKINYSNYTVMVLDNNSEDESLEKIKDYAGRMGRFQDPDVKSSSSKSNFLNEHIKFDVFNYNGEFHSNKLNPAEIENFHLNHMQNNLILIENDKNYGFAQGNNIGMEFALKYLSSDYILLLNNDTVVDENFLTELVNEAEKNDQFGFLGPKTYFYQDKNKIQAAGGANIDFIHGESVRVGYDLEDDGRVFCDNQEIDYIMGSCILVRKKVIEKIGFLDATYFTYWEDADWCFRGRESGYKSFYVAKSKIWHKEGTSSPSYSRIYYHSRNRLYFMRKHASKSQYYRFLLYYVPFIVIERLFYFIKVRDLRMYSSMFWGMIDGFRL